MSQSVKSSGLRSITLVLLLCIVACGSQNPAPPPKEDATLVSIEKDTEADDPQRAIASQVPNTDIFLFEIDVHHADLVVGFLGNATNRSGYDNQPKFIPGTNDLIFSSIADGNQSDAYLLRSNTRQPNQLTRTARSEYSPTPFADGTFSAVVVEEDGTQRLWLYNADGTPRGAIRGDITGVGYHAFLSSRLLALFIVAEPMRLDIVSRNDGAVTTVATNIGRSLHAMPGGKALSFVQHREERPGMLSSWTIGKDEITSLVQMPVNVEDMVWLEDGRALAVAGDKLVMWKPGQQDWSTVTDLSRFMTGTSTRLAVNDAQTRLAIVTELAEGM